MSEVQKGIMLGLAIAATERGGSPYATELFRRLEQVWGIIDPDWGVETRRQLIEDLLP